jgi:hypothetical protein
MLIIPQMNEKIFKFMFCCIRDPGMTVFGFGNKTMLLRGRYCPVLMLCLEGLSKIIHLTLIILYSSNTESQKFLSPIIVIFIISVFLYELGLIEEKRWAVSPSIVFNYLELERRRMWNVANHFFVDIWKLFDLFSISLELVWLFLAISSNSYSSGNKILSISCIPMSLGILRYPSLFNDYFGTLVLNVFTVMRSLFNFLIIYALTGLGFGVALYSIFRHDFQEYSNIKSIIKTLLDSALLNYDSSMFNSSINSSYGTTLTFSFILWTVFVLFTCVIAHVSANYSKFWCESYKLLLLIKCRQIQQFNLSLEKSPLCMLPPPLNLISTSFYPFHVYLAWRDRLFIDRVYTISLAGVID